MISFLRIDHRAYANNSCAINCFYEMPAALHTYFWNHSALSKKCIGHFRRLALSDSQGSYLTLSPCLHELIGHTSQGVVLFRWYIESVRASMAIHINIYIYILYIIKVWPIIVVLTNLCLVLFLQCIWSKPELHHEWRFNFPRVRTSMVSCCGEGSREDLQ